MEKGRWRVGRGEIDVRVGECVQQGGGGRRFFLMEERHEVDGGMGKPGEKWGKAREREGGRRKGGIGGSNSGRVTRSCPKKARG